MVAGSCQDQVDSSPDELSNMDGLTLKEAYVQNKDTPMMQKYSKLKPELNRHKFL